MHLYKKIESFDMIENDMKKYLDGKVNSWKGPQVSSLADQQEGKGGIHRGRIIESVCCPDGNGHCVCRTDLYRNFSPDYRCDLSENSKRRDEGRAGTADGSPGENGNRQPAGNDCRGISSDCRRFGRRYQCHPDFISERNINSRSRT